MSRERVVLCGGASGEAPPFADPSPLVLRLYGRGRNIRLKLNDIEFRLLSHIPPLFQDLIEIATYVYCADQAIRRRVGVDDLGRSWRRRLHFRIPVRDPDTWSADALRGKLCSTLGFLSEDVYSFDFTKLTSAPAGTRFLFDSGQTADSVAMFSGGLDSLCGAVREAVVAGRQIALVRHRSNNKLESRTNHLKSMLAQRCARPPIHFTLDISKAKYLSCEYTQRSRSFLYMALGGCVAHLLGLQSLRFYENGVVSFNLPPTVQVVGAKATRTTHPQVLNGFADILSSIAAKKFTVENHLLWLTKAEVVREIIGAGCGPLVNYSSSCAHTWEKTRRHPHCGSCSQCIDRRFATLGERADDDADGYHFKLLTDAPADGEDLAMLASYVETASRVATMTPEEFMARFGEVARLLHHVGGNPDHVAKLVVDLYQRHARQVTAVVDSAIAENASAIRGRTLPDNCLLRLVCDRSSLPASATASSDPPTVPVAASSAAAPVALQLTISRNAFVRKGAAWIAKYNGGPENIVLPSRGADYIHALLSQPGVAVPATKLAADAAGQRAVQAATSSDPNSDEEAMRAYRAEYTRLQEDIEEAKERGDVAGQELAEKNRDAFVARVQRDQGVGGRLRADNDARDKVRKAVWIAIQRALDSLQTYDRELAEHLRVSIVRGHQIEYRPPTATDWQT